MGLVTAAVGWRWALGALVVLPLSGALLMRRTLPGRRRPRSRGAARLTRAVAQPAGAAPGAAASALFFTFVSVFSYVTFRLTEPPFDYGTGTMSLLFVLWVMGAAGPGRAAGRPRGLAQGGGARQRLAITGVLLSLPDELATIVPGLAMVVLGMFTGVTAAQLGVSDAGDTDRGTASAVYFTFYYVAGRSPASCPAWPGSAWGWPVWWRFALGRCRWAWLPWHGRDERRHSPPPRWYDSCPGTREELGMAMTGFTSNNLLIGGEWTAASAGGSFEKTDPYTGEPAGSAAAAKRDDARGRRRRRGQGLPRLGRQPAGGDVASCSRRPRR